MNENQTVGKGIVFLDRDDDGNVVLIEDPREIVVGVDPLITASYSIDKGTVLIYNWDTDEGIHLDRQALLGAIL